MGVIGVFSKIFGGICIAVGILLFGIGFAAFNENDDYFSAILLTVGAVFMWGVGYHFFVVQV